MCVTRTLAASQAATRAYESPSKTLLTLWAAWGLFYHFGRLGGDLGLPDQFGLFPLQRAQWGVWGPR